jgi:hypothetical protein
MGLTATPQRATLVRPQGEPLRQRLLELLQEIGIEATAEDVLSSELDDDEVVAALRQRGSSQLLVVPFRQPTAGGGRAHGIDLLQRLEQEVPETAGLPVLLPVNVFSAGQVRLMLGESNPDETLSRRTRHRILMLLEDELADPRSAELLRMHLRLRRAEPANLG